VPSRTRSSWTRGVTLRDGSAERVKVVAEDTPLATALTPVYPTSAQLPQAYLRKAVAANLARADLAELLPPEVVPRGLASLREALTFLHHPAPSVGMATLEDRSHPAWQRLKFEELLAQLAAEEKARCAGLGTPGAGRRPSRLRVLSGIALPEMPHRPRALNSLERNECL